VKRGHADLESRNIYLNPKRGDQTVIRVQEDQWELLALPEAIELILDGVSKGMHGVILKAPMRKVLSLEAQNALAIAEMLYLSDPISYAKKVAPRVIVHLANMAPPSIKTK
jgi:hypothetical protein